MSRSGLARFGVVSRTVVRTPAHDRDRLVICPECGVPVGASRGSHTIIGPDLLDEDLGELVGRELVTLGWVCEQHQYDIVLPETCHGSEAPSFVSDWIGVELRFADEIVRWIATPAKEIEIARGRATDSKEGGESDGV